MPGQGMGAGKPGPSKSKLRAIWRTYRRKLEENRARAEAKRAAGLEPSETLLDLIRMEEEHTSGRSTPVGIMHGPWREVCDELNRAG